MPQTEAAARKGSDPELVDVQAVYNALRDLSEEQRQRVIASVQALLGSVTLADAADTPRPHQPSLPTATTSASASTSRPMSLVEVIKDKEPKTNTDYIVLFAYYRDMHENLPRFARDDLKPYFGKGRLDPPANYDRDFVKAVERGWLHEDGTDSYLTSRGIEAVESNFPSERRSRGAASGRPVTKRRTGRPKSKSGTLRKGPARPINKRKGA